MQNFLAFIIGWASVFMSLVAYLSAAKARCASAIFWFFYFWIVGIASVLYTITAINDVGLGNGLLLGVVYIFLFTTILFLLTQLRLSVFGSMPIDYLQAPVNRSRKELVFSIAVMLGYLAAFQKISGGDLLSIAWNDRHELSALFSLLNILFAVAVAIIYKEWREGNKVIFLAMMFMAIVIVVLGRSRAGLLIVFAVPLVELIRARRHFLLFACSLCGIFLALVMQQVRYLGGLDAALNYSWGYIFEDAFLKLSSGESDLGLISHFFKFIAYSDMYENLFYHGETYRRIFFIWLPSAMSLGLKPEDFTFNMAFAVSGVEGWSLHPTVIGDSFANFHYLGVVFVPIVLTMLFVLVGKIQRKIGKNIYLIVPSTCTGLFFIARGSVYNGLFSILVPALAVLVIMFVGTLIARVKNTR